MSKVIELYNKLKPNIDLNKEHPEKFLPSLVVADDTNIDLLADNGFKINKPSQFIVYDCDKEFLNKNITQSNALGLKDAYIQNPRHLTRSIDDISRKVSKFEAMGIPYKNEKGKYQSYLFSNRGSEYIIRQISKDENKSKNEDNLETSVTTDLDVVKEQALRIMEEFSLTDKKNEVDKRIDEIGNKGLSEKEILMEAFKNYAADLNFLSDKIDQILAFNQSQRRVA